VIAKNFNALGGDDKPHQYGTVMAGAIAAPENSSASRRARSFWRRAPSTRT
jgi:hypothetical protein